MDRPIVYAGAQPLETDILNLARNVMVGLGRLAMDVLGTSTAVSGLPCTPTSPATMSVAIGAGAPLTALPWVGLAMAVASFALTLVSASMEKRARQRMGVGESTSCV